jgi:glyoxylase I family protein
MSIQIKGIDHVVLLVSNVKRSINFYCDALGCSVDTERPDLGLYHLRAGTAFIDLVDIHGKLGNQSLGPRKAEGRNLDHFALRIEPFVEQGISSHLTAFDVKVGEVAQRYGADDDSPPIYISDPNNNTIELKGPANETPPTN